MAQPVVDIDKYPYDLTTFSGRYHHFVRITSPAHLLATDSQLDAARSLVANYRASPRQFADTPAAQLWAAKYLLDASLHPDTGDKVFLPFRMASFVPTNLLVTVGMLLPNPGVRGIVFWQWMNQSINVGFNWANANKTTSMTVGETLFAYGSAVTASVSVALGLDRLVRSTGLLSPATKAFASRFVPFVAVASAGSINVFLMRRKEIVEGIDIRGEDGQVVGKSSIAGMQAVSQVALSRIATSFPCLTVVPLILSRLETMSFFRGSKPRILAANVALITGALFYALPAAIALFPQRGLIAAHKLEPEFGNLKNLDGSPVRQFTFNKGL